jgi:hypothetical protein
VSGSRHKSAFQEVHTEKGDCSHSASCTSEKWVGGLTCSGRETESGYDLDLLARTHRQQLVHDDSGSGSPWGIKMTDKLTDWVTLIHHAVEILGRHVWRD